MRKRRELAVKVTHLRQGCENWWCAKAKELQLFSASSKSEKLFQLIGKTEKKSQAPEFIEEMNCSLIFNQNVV